MQQAAVVDRIRSAVQDTLGTAGGVVLAVSGGVDSMVLLDAAAATVPAERLVVATFDHGTGPMATAAAALVARSAAARGITCVAGGNAGAPAAARGREAVWREARWTFLREVASQASSRVATAHTRDDQVETVLLRVMRGAGARGIASLLAPGETLRPLIEQSRADIERYAAARGIEWVEDPGNATREHARNRARLDLLPAIRSVDPTFDGELLQLSRRAAAWRRELDAVVDASIPHRLSRRGDALEVDADSIAAHPAGIRAMLWSALAGRVGVALDWRGTQRLAAFTIEGRVGRRVPLSGGWTVIRSREGFTLRREDAPVPEPVALSSEGPVHWGGWRFAPAAPGAGEDPWLAWLPVTPPPVVRRWNAGDAMVVRAGEAPAKVKRLLSDAGVTGAARSTWPVVVSDGAIVWVPGVRRGAAATDRSGRPGLPFLCEHTDF